MIGLIILAYLAIGYLVSVVVYYSKLKNYYGYVLIESKTDFLWCLGLWPVVFIVLTLYLSMKLLSKIPWPVYKDLDE